MYDELRSSCNSPVRVILTLHDLHVETCTSHVNLLLYQSNVYMFWGNISKNCSEQNWCTYMYTVAQHVSVHYNKHTHACMKWSGWKSSACLFPNSVCWEGSRHVWTNMYTLTHCWVFVAWNMWAALWEVICTDSGWRLVANVLWTPFCLHLELYVRVWLLHSVLVHQRRWSWVT